MRHFLPAREQVEVLMIADCGMQIVVWLEWLFSGIWFGFPALLNCRALESGEEVIGRHIECFDPTRI